MHKPSLIEITESLRLHSLWLANSPKGKKADFSNQDLGSADLRSANLSSANLGSADLRSANLGYANLGYANLGYANLGSADLRSANLHSANLGYANLGYANLGYADLHSANLGYAKYNQKTRWPKFSVLLSAYWPNEDKEIEALAKPKVEALLSKYLVLGAPAEPEPKPSCEGKVVEIDGRRYKLIEEKR